MSEHIEQIRVAGDGITVPLLIWRRFREHMPGLAERVWAVNPGLADLGMFLPVGTVVNMPIPAAVEDSAPASKIELW